MKPNILSERLARLQKNRLRLLGLLQLLAQHRHAVVDLHHLEHHHQDEDEYGEGHLEEEVQKLILMGEGPRF